MNNKKHLIHILLLLITTFVLSGCFAGANEFSFMRAPDTWDEANKITAEAANAESLSRWWTYFDDPVLNDLITLTLTDSPDRNIAEARITEARGLQRTTRSSLFPQVGASAAKGRQQAVFLDAGDFYDARFDASFEIDLFGQNRKRVDAGNARIKALEAQYHDVSLTLIAEVMRVYINYRLFQKQVYIAEKNLELQNKSLGLIKELKELGESPQLDVDRAQTLVNTTRASIPNFKRQAETARLQLTVLTGAMPDVLKPLLQKSAPIPGGKTKPALLAPAQVLAYRPDIRAAEYGLYENTKLAEAATADLFPTFTLSGFYGVTDNAIVDSLTVWNIALGAAVTLLDFGRLEGQIDAARAREVQAYEQYRKAVLSAVTEVETALNDYAHINEQRISLQKAYNSADNALGLSENLFREGEISFIDVLDSQRSVNEADSALANAEAAQAESLVRLYKSLGVY